VCIVRNEQNQITKVCSLTKACYKQIEKQRINSIGRNVSIKLPRCICLPKYN